MRVCVTGGSGFIGWFLCHALAGRGDELTIIDLAEPGDDLPPHRFVRGDIRDPDALREAMQGCRTIYHLAAAHHDFGIAEATFDDVNRRGSELMCEVADELSVRDICFYSTVAVYGAAPEPHTEETPPQPQSAYGRTKLAGEEVFRRWTENGDDRHCTVIRPTVTFGPRNFANMYSLIRQIDGGRFVMVGRGTNVKSLSYVENIVDATLFLRDRDDLPPFDVFNYVEKPDFDSRTIAATVYEALGRRAPGWSIPMWAARVAALPFDALIALTGRNIPISGARVRKLFSDQTKFESDKILGLGFEPEVSLREGIERMVRWYQETGREQTAQWRQPPAIVEPRQGFAASSSTSA